MNSFPIQALDLDIDEGTESKEIEFGQPQLSEFYRKNEENIQSLFKCPITYFIPSDPVVADDGNIYEEDAISTWCSSNSGRSPLTNQKISNSFQTIPLWNDIVNMFIKIDPELKNILTEKDYTFENNKDTIKSILGSKQKHPNLLKFKGFVMSESFGYGTFTTALFSSCHDIKIIKHVIENSSDFKLSDYNYNVFEAVCNYSTPEIVKYFISNGYDIMNSVNDRLIAITLMNNGNCAEDIELNTMISNSLKNTQLLADGTPVIVYCVKRSSLGLIKTIVEGGHDILAKDSNGDNLLKIAANSNRDESIIMYLIEQIHLKDKDVVEQPITNDGRTIVHWILTAGYGKKPTVDTIKRLIQIGINMEIVNPTNNWRPIHYICRYCTTSVIFYVMGIGVSLTDTCMHDGIETPPLALLDINSNIKDSDREQLLNEFFQFVELQNLTKN